MPELNSTTCRAGKIPVFAPPTQNGNRSLGIPSDNETWILEAGDAVLDKRLNQGAETLSLSERLIYCVWVADYGMRNAGQLETASDLHSNFKRDAVRLSKALGLGFVTDSFELPDQLLEQEYFERFDEICREVRRVTEATYND